jgi:hypothetical protein
MKAEEILLRLRGPLAINKSDGFKQQWWRRPKVQVEMSRKH